MDKPDKEAQAGGGGLFGDEPEEDRRIHWAVEELMELIYKSIGDSDEWLDEESTIEAHGHIFIIKTTPDNHRQLKQFLDTLLQAEIDKQAAILKDAHVSEWVAQANRLLQRGQTEEARRLIDKALRVLPDHVPANAAKQVIDLLPPKAKPIG